MALFENFPYTNLHNLNLDWIVKVLKEINEKFDEAIAAKVKFADPLQWDITRQYPAFTIVEDHEKFYLSSQAVPAGVDINDDTYWQQIFDMSDLYQMMEDYEAQVNQQIEDFTEQVTDQVEGLEETTVKNNSTRHLLFVGDSYAVWNQSHLYNVFVRDVGIPAAQCHNVAVAGRCFSDPTQSYIAEISDYTGDKTEITDILVTGGINDALIQFDVPGYPDMTVLISAMQAFIDYAHANYPNANVSIAYIGGCMPNSWLYTQYHPAKSQEMALYAYTVVAAGMGYRVLKTYNALHSSPAYYDTADYLHPNPDGSALLGTTLAKAFNNEYYPVIRPDHVETLYYQSGVARAGSAQYNMSMIDDLTEIYIQDSYFNLSQGAVVGNTFVECANLENESFTIRSPIQIETTALMTSFTDTPAYHPVPCSIKFENGKIYIKVSEVVNGSFKNFTAASDYAAITILGYHIALRTFNIN